LLTGAYPTGDCLADRSGSDNDNDVAHAVVLY